MQDCFRAVAHVAGDDGDCDGGGGGGGGGGAYDGSCGHDGSGRGSLAGPPSGSKPFRICSRASSPSGAT
eukprot:5016651-Pleurochrysis_carterae.AAC.5